MVDDLWDQLQCCDFDLPAGQMHALPGACEGPWIRTASLKAKKRRRRVNGCSDQGK